MRGWGVGEGEGYAWRSIVELGTMAAEEVVVTWQLWSEIAIR